MNTNEYVRLRYLLAEVDERSGADEPPLLSVSIHSGVQRRDQLTDDEHRADTLDHYKRCRSGDIVLNRMRAFQGAVGVAPIDGLVSPDYAVLRVDGRSDARFIAYVLRSRWGIAEMAARLRGIGGVSSGVVRTPRINVEELRSIRVFAPSVDRQCRLADFLDREIDRISSIQKACERTTFALGDERREMFERLTADAPTVALRYRLVGIQQGWSPECEASLAEPGEWGVLKVGCVNYGRFRPEEHKRLPDDLSARPELEIRLGDVLMSRANTRELVGSAATVTELSGYRLMLCDLLYRLSPVPSLRPGFLSQALSSRPVRGQIESSAAGAAGSMPKISHATIRELRIADVPPERQLCIETEVSERLASLDRTSGTITRLATRLGDYRESLIAEAVTGQLDIDSLTEGEMNERLHAVGEGVLGPAAK